MRHVKWKSTVISRGSRYKGGKGKWKKTANFQMMFDHSWQSKSIKCLCIRTTTTTWKKNRPIKSDKTIYLLVLQYRYCNRQTTNIRKRTRKKTKTTKIWKSKIEHIFSTAFPFAHISLIRSNLIRLLHPGAAVFLSLYLSLFRPYYKLRSFVFVLQLWPNCSDFVLFSLIQRIWVFVCCARDFEIVMSAWWCGFYLSKQDLKKKGIHWNR